MEHELYTDHVRSVRADTKGSGRKHRSDVGDDTVRFFPGSRSASRLCLSATGTSTVARARSLRVRLSRRNANRSKRASVRTTPVSDPASVQPSGGAAAWSSCSLGSLCLRDSPLKKRFAVVDTASMPTPALLYDAMRARADMWLLLVGARKKTGIMSRASNVMC